MRTRHQLIAAEPSRHSATVRAYLRFKKIAFDEHAASPETYRTQVAPRTRSRSIPLYVSEHGVVVQGVHAILEFVELRHPSAAVFPKWPVQRLIALLVAAYAEDWLVLPALHYRYSIGENVAFLVEDLGRLAAPDDAHAVQREIGLRLAARFRAACVPLGILPASAPGIEASYLGFLSDLEQHLTFQPYLLGTRPSFGDFALVGPLYAHLYRDPASGRLLRDRAPRVAAWVERMMVPPRPLSGSFLDEDLLPPGIETLVARIFRELGPLWSQGAAALARSAHDALGSLGTATLALGGAQLVRSIERSTLARFQRAHAHYQSLTGSARAQADELLRQCGGLALLQAPLPFPRHAERGLEQA